MKYGLKRPRSTLGRPMNHGFTLVELLLAIMVVGILASMTIVVTTQAMYSAKVEKTKSTIAKLDVVLSEMYENFETRRLPLSNLPSNQFLAHTARTWFLRDLMRMEMPHNFEEIETGAVGFQFPGDNRFFSVGDSPLRKLYWNVVYDNNGNKVANNRFESAKCLYLIITLGNPESREAFHDSEIATDSDGLSYFIDGWGNPIGFLRWAPGLINSDRQPIINNLSDINNVEEQFPDPFNPLLVYSEISNWQSTEITNPSNRASAKTRYDATCEVINIAHRSSSSLENISWGIVPLVCSSGSELDNDGSPFFGIRRSNVTGNNVLLDPFNCGSSSNNNRDIQNFPGSPESSTNFNIITNHTSRR